MTNGLHGCFGDATNYLRFGFSIQRPDFLASSSIKGACRVGYVRRGSGTSGIMKSPVPRAKGHFDAMSPLNGFTNPGQRQPGRPNQQLPSVDIRSLPPVAKAPGRKLRWAGKGGVAVPGSRSVSRLSPAPRRSARSTARSTRLK